MRKLIYTVMLCAAFLSAKSFDDKLRDEALKIGLKSTPKDFGSLVRAMNERNITLSADAIRLGKKLFFDTRFSKSGSISCASCHDVSKGGDDGQPTAIGHEGAANPSHLNTPTVLNTAFSKRLFWDGRVDSLEKQAAGPLFAHFEMASDKRRIEMLISSDMEYIRMFKAAFGAHPNFPNMLKAIASYERTLVTRGAYDRFLEGDSNAISDGAKRGFRIFLDRGCGLCHTGAALGGEEMRKFPIRYHKAWSMAGLKVAKNVLKEYEKYSKMQFRSEDSRYDIVLMGLGEQKTKLLSEGFFKQYTKVETNATKGFQCKGCHSEKKNLEASVFPFVNEGGFLGDKNRRYFRTPILRNISKTAPYFHNGTVKKLEEAVELMGAHQLGVTFDKRQVANLVEFLKTLDGELVNYGF